VALVRTDVSEEIIASIIRVKRIIELGIALAITRAEKQTSKQMTCEVTKYNISNKITTIIIPNRSIITALRLIIIIK
jgi:hypothetical protein